MLKQKGEKLGRKRRNYLWRVLLIVVFLLFFPIVLLINFLCKNSIREMEQSNEVYYEKMVGSFENAFTEKVTELRLHALSIVSDSKDAKSGFWRGYEGFQENKYWYYEAVKDMRENYMNHNASECGVYYYADDKIVHEQGASSVEQYIQSYLVVDNGLTKSLDFFEEENYETAKMIFSTTNTTDYFGGSLLVGYCTELGRNRDKALIFYCIEPEDYEDPVGKTYRDDEIVFCLLSEERDQVLLAIGESAQKIGLIEWEQESRKIAGIHQKLLYHVESRYFPITFVVYVSDDVIQNKLLLFYQSVKILITIVTFVLSGICLFLVYIVYKPVQSLIAGLEHYAGGEFETIHNSLNVRKNQIKEQEMLIMDLLLEHLVFGLPISEDRLRHLGINSDIQYYLVAILEGHILLNNETEDLSFEIRKQFDARLLITDWQDKNRNIMIFLLNRSSVEDIEQFMKKWCDSRLVTGYVLCCGKVVERIDDIRSSFLSCLVKMGEPEKDYFIKRDIVVPNHRTEKLERKLKGILEYIEIHYCDEDLSQVQVADNFQLSNYSLSRLFKSHLGIGFTEYINGKRLEKAKELLLTTSYSIREISVKVGFVNDNYFSRLFKDTVGMSPTAFRKQ